MPKEQDQIVQDYEVLKVEKHFSKFGGDFYYVFFKGLTDMQSYKTPVYVKLRNFNRWRLVLDFNNPESNAGMVLGNLKLKNVKKRIIDADSQVTIIKRADNK